MNNPMNTQAEIADFLAQRTLAVVGVSRSGKKFGNAAFRELRAKGYRVYPVNPHAESVEGEPCHPSVRELPEPVGGVICAVPPDQTEQVVRDAVGAGIRRVWMQQGSESAQALALCQQHGITAIHDQCVLMFAQPTGVPHRMHRFIRKVTRRLPR